MQTYNTAKQTYPLIIAFLSGVILTILTKIDPFIFKPLLINQAISADTWNTHLNSNSNQAISTRPLAFEGCGTWQQAYIERHRAILNGKLPPRYLVSVAVEAGVADRLTGTLTEFFFALLTNRAFQIITYGTLARFEAAFSTPHINWSRPVYDDILIDNLKFTYRGVRGYGGDRSYGSNVDTKLYWPVFLVNDEKGNEFFVSSNVSKYPIDHDNVPTIFVASNRGRIVRLFDNPYHRSQLFQMGLRPETAFKCGFNFLFSPTDAVRTRMSRIFSALESPDVLKISIYIRAGDQVFDPKHDADITIAPFEAYFHCASTIESFARLPNQRVIWYFNSDSLRLRQLVKERYREKILTEDKLRYFHIDCDNPAAKRNGNCTKEFQDSLIQLSVGQMYAMSMCDYYVVTPGSGFGRIPPFLSHFWHNVYQVGFNGQNRSCAQADYDPIETVSSIPAAI